MEYYTTTAYSEKTGRTVDNVRHHCAKGSLESVKIAGAGHGVYLIPEGAEVHLEKQGRKPKGK